jgi:hypothetical protein
MPRATQFKNMMVKPRTLAAATTLTEVDSGKTIFLNLAAGIAVTLPKVKAGLSFNFIVKTAPSGGNYTINSVNQNEMFGQVYTCDVNAEADADFNIYAVSTLTLTNSKAVVGDRVEMISDGTYWYVKAFCSVYDAMALTISPSKSPSVSTSISTSRSPSTSTSKSPSASVSKSPSASPSTSRSASPSISPSPS